MSAPKRKRNVQVNFRVSPEELALIEQTREAYQKVLDERGFGPITTEIAPASEYPFYPAEDYHQQYLQKVPNGYRCHANTGVPLPV